MNTLNSLSKKYRALQIYPRALWMFTEDPLYLLADESIYQDQFGACTLEIQNSPAGVGFMNKIVEEGITFKEVKLAEMSFTLWKLQDMVAHQN